MNEWKTNNSENVSADKFIAIVIAYNNCIRGETLDSINSNNSQTLTSDPTVVYAKRINYLLRFDSIRRPENRTVKYLNDMKRANNYLRSKRDKLIFFFSWLNGDYNR